MRRLIVVVLAVLALVIGMAVPAMAGTTANVVITAQPAYIVVTQTQLTWTLNGVFATGDGVTPKNYIVPSDTYYANPLGDGTPPSATVVAAECYFDIVTTGSSLPLTLTVNCSDFTGGGATMTNGNGTNGATAYAGFCWGNGTLYANKVIMKTSASSVMKSSLTPCASYPWGAEILTRSNAWTVAGNSTAQMILTATATP